MAGVPAEEPTLVAFNFPDVAKSGVDLDFPSVVVGSAQYHSGDTITVTLDHPVLAHGTLTTTFDFEAVIDYDASYPHHFIPPFMPWTTSSIVLPERGIYRFTEVTVTQASTGLTAIYGAGDLASLGFSTQILAIEQAPSNLWMDDISDIAWRDASGALRPWVADTSTGSLRFAAQGPTPDLSVAPSWTALEVMNNAEILWQNADGRISVWHAGLYQTASGSYRTNLTTYDHSPVGSEWKIAATGDVNHDGQSDILWQRSDGAISVWNASAGSFVENSYYHASVGTDWVVEGLSDFTGDYRADILWRNVDGSLSTWNATAGATASDTSFLENSWYHSPIDLSWHVVGLGDFNGDGKDDILWHNDDGSLSVWTSSGTGFTENQMNGNAATIWNVAEVGDYNGDGKMDILWRNSDGAISVWTSTGNSWNQNAYYDASAGTDWSLIAHHFVL